MKIGIVCDDYKLDKFKERLSSARVEFKTTPFVKDTTTITLTVPVHRLAEIKRLCEQIEREFKNP